MLLENENPVPTGASTKMMLANYGIIIIVHKQSQKMVGGKVKEDEKPQI